MAELKVIFNKDTSEATLGIALALTIMFGAQSCNNNKNIEKQAEQNCYKTLAESKAWKAGQFSRMNYLPSKDGTLGQCFLDDKIAPSIIPE